MKKIGAVVILYHPEPKFINNILSYSAFVHELIIVDNTPNGRSDTVFHDGLTAHYIISDPDTGYAEALNTGLRHLVSLQCQLALIMDQDSRFAADHLTEFFTTAETIDWNKTGILAPAQRPLTKKRAEGMPSIQPLLLCMTSGMLLNLTIYENIGPFNERFFIDHVDHEYCLRLIAAGYRILQASDVFMIHELGKKDVARIGKLNLFTYISHHPLRGYYFIRNGLYLISKFKNGRLLIAELLLKEAIKAVFLQSSKKYRVQLMLTAIHDFRKSVYGKRSLQTLHPKVNKQ